MSSSRLVAKTINAAGRTYSRLYRVLCLLRAHRLSSDPMAFQDFQSRLFETLLALQELYDRVSSTRSRHISRKAFVTEGWFLQRMRATDSHLRALREAMRVGKALGDAFAWPFYLNDAQLLDEHATAVRQDHVPSGVGGRSLLQVMRGLRTWRGYFLLYHDITTTLRRGDFSLVAFERMRIAGLGEQKAGKPQDGTVPIEWKIIFPASELVCIGGTSTSVARPLGLDARSAGRQHRQVSAMVASFDKAGAPPKGPIMQAHVDPYYATLERAIEDAAKHGVGSGFAGECIYLVAVTTTGRGLGRRLVGETQELLGIESRLEDAAKGLLVPGAPDNTLLVETLLYPRDRRSLLLGMAPPFWWDLRTRSLRRVYLGQVLVLTIGNPARLHSHYRRLGFDLEYREDESGPVLVRAIGERRLELTGTGYYWRAVSEHLYSAQAIADKLEEVVGHAASSEATRIDIRFRHRHWPSGSRRRKG